MRSGGEREHQGDTWGKRTSPDKIAQCGRQGPELARGTVVGGVRNEVKAGTRWKANPPGQNEKGGEDTEYEKQGLAGERDGLTASIPVQIPALP